MGAGRCELYCCGVSAESFGQVQESLENGRPRLSQPGRLCLDSRGWRGGSREALGHGGSSDVCCFTINIILQGRGSGEEELKYSPGLEGCQILWSVSFSIPIAFGSPATVTNSTTV